MASQVPPRPMFPMLTTRSKAVARGSLGAALILLVAAGCGGSTSRPPEAAPISEAGKALRESFKGSKGETKALSSGVGDAIEGGRYPDAYVLVNQLAAKPELNPSERAAAGQARVSLMNKLREAAAGGDKTASDILEHHRATK